MSDEIQLFNEVPLAELADHPHFGATTSGPEDREPRCACADMFARWEAPPFGGKAFGSSRN
jgi:hypothetical protein